MKRTLSIMAIIVVVMLISSCEATTEKTTNASTPSSPSPESPAQLATTPAAEPNNANKIHIVGILLKSDGSPASRTTIYLAPLRSYKGKPTSDTSMFSNENGIANPKGGSDDTGHFSIEVDPQFVDTVTKSKNMFGEKMSHFTIATLEETPVGGLFAIGNNGKLVAFKIDKDSKEINLGNISVSKVDPTLSISGGGKSR